VTQSSGRVLQVSVSPGGLPKLPVERAWVGRLGLEGDAHHDDTVHGGPHRAVCLFGIEAIERLQAEGHPLGSGSVGENLTTSGIEWSLLPVGTYAMTPVWASGHQSGIFSWEYLRSLCDCDDCTAARRR